MSKRKCAFRCIATKSSDTVFLLSYTVDSRALVVTRLVLLQTAIIIVGVRSQLTYFSDNITFGPNKVTIFAFLKKSVPQPSEA